MGPLTAALPFISAAFTVFSTISSLSSNADESQIEQDNIARNNADIRRQEAFDIEAAETNKRLAIRDADIAKADANKVAAAGQQRASAERRVRELAYSKSQANAAAAGGGLDDIYGALDSVLTYNINSALYEGSSQEARFKSDADMSLWEASNFERDKLIIGDNATRNINLNSKRSKNVSTRLKNKQIGTVLSGAGSLAGSFSKSKTKTTQTRGGTTYGPPGRPSRGSTRLRIR